MRVLGLNKEDLTNIGCETLFISWTTLQYCHKNAPIRGHYLWKFQMNAYSIIECVVCLMAKYFDFIIFNCRRNAMFARQQFFIIRSLIRNLTSNYVLNYVIRHTKFCKRINQIVSNSISITL